MKILPVIIWLSIVFGCLGLFSYGLYDTHQTSKAKIEVQQKKAFLLQEKIRHIVDKKLVVMEITDGRIVFEDGTSLHFYSVSRHSSGSYLEIE